MRKWALNDSEAFFKSSLTKGEYIEKGPEWFKEQRFSGNMSSDL